MLQTLPILIHTLKISLGINPIPDMDFIGYSAKNLYSVYFQNGITKIDITLECIQCTVQQIFNRNGI